MDIILYCSNPLLEDRLGEWGALLADSDIPHRLVCGGAGSTATVWSAGTGEVTYVSTRESEILFDGYINNHSAASLSEHLCKVAERLQSRSPLLQFNESGVFNVLVHEKQTGKVLLGSDPSGLWPLYYSTGNGVLTVSTHLHLLAGFLQTGPDRVGVLSKLIHGYSIGSRTYYRGLKRVQAGELLEWNPGSSDLRSQCYGGYFTQYSNDEKHLDERVWHALQKATQSSLANAPSLGVMLSEGCDSRLIAGVAARVGMHVGAFTHGTAGTKGATIPPQVARALNIDFHFHDLSDGLITDPEGLRAQLYLSDNLNIPFWVHGSNHFRQKGISATTTGTALDSTLGGHAFCLPSNKRLAAVTQRYREILLQDARLMTRNYVERLANILLNNFSTFDHTKIKDWLERWLAPDLCGELLRHLDGLKHDITSEYTRLRQAGCVFPSQVLQRFFLENRARQYSFGQELTLRIHNRVIVPSYEHAFMNVMSTVHPVHRLHHKLYLKVFRRFLPELTEITNGGYNLPLTYPRLILESFRFIGKLKEQELIRKFLSSEGMSSISGYRAVCFGEIASRRGNAIAFLRSRLHANRDVLNSSSLSRWLDDIVSYKSKAFSLDIFYRLLEVCVCLRGRY